MASTFILQATVACKLVRIIIMPFLQSTVATMERHSRSLGLLILNDQNHVSRRPGTKSTSLLADKNYLHICRPSWPARRKTIQKHRESWWWKQMDDTIKRSIVWLIDIPQHRSQKNRSSAYLFNIALNKQELLPKVLAAKKQWPRSLLLLEKIETTKQ